MPRLEEIPPYEVDGKKAFVRRMFDDIHARYDLLNTILSFGQDRRWRKITVKDMPSDGIIIDLCSAGGELAHELFARPDFNGQIVMADISKQMISLYRRILGPQYSGRYFPVICDVENLPFKKGVFAGSMSAFSLRNLTNLGRLTGEVRRALEPRGLARYLEIAHPQNKLLETAFKLYFYHISPLVARFFTNKTYAYRYLPSSLKAFPRQDEAARLLSEGWAECDYRNIFGGMAAVYRLANGKMDDA